MWICMTFSELTYYVDQFSSVAQSCPTLCDPMNCSMPGLPVHHQLTESTQTHVHWVGDAVQPSHPLSSPSPSALNPSQHQGLCKWVSSLHQVAKVLKFHLPMNNQSGLICCCIFLQSKGLSRVFSNTTVQKHQILQCSAFFIVQLSHPYMTTGKTIALTTQIFAGKVISLLFNMLSRLIIAFLPRSERLLISRLQSPCSDSEAQENKICHCSFF